MTIDRMIELLKIERECMLRGAHDVCDRNCAECELVQDDYELNEMYINVISLLKDYEKTRLDLTHEMIEGPILMYQGKELVRCKDCKHGKINDCEEFTTCYNKSSCLYGNTRKSNWWCADVERRTDDA